MCHPERSAGCSENWQRVVEGPAVRSNNIPIPVNSRSLHSELKPSVGMTQEEYFKLLASMRQYCRLFCSLTTIHCLVHSSHPPVTRLTASSFVKPILEMYAAALAECLITQALAKVVPPAIDAGSASPREVTYGDRNRTQHF